MPEDVRINPVCPYCGHHTVYKPDGWVEGGPLACANPYCDTNHPPPAHEQSHEPAIALLREISACEQVPTWMRAEADQVLNRVYGVGSDEL